VFVRDRVAGTTTRVSVSTSGGQANRNSGEFDVTISADGRYVAFASDASNLVDGDMNGQTDVFVRNLAAGTTTRVSVSSFGWRRRWCCTAKWRSRSMDSLEELKQSVAVCIGNA
jgi:Tol biopolymer transport system component